MTLSPRAGLLGIVGLLFAAGCAAPAEEAVATSSSNLGETATAITFGADWSVHTDGILTAGTTVKVVYDEDRNPICRGEQNGAPAWSVTGHVRAITDVTLGLPFTDVELPKSSCIALTM